MSYTEGILVQQATADNLERPFDWTSVYAYNNEIFGPGRFLNGDTAKRRYE